jgi:hypothetical protein
MFPQISFAGLRPCPVGAGSSMQGLQLESGALLHFESVEQRPPGLVQFLQSRPRGQGAPQAHRLEDAVPLDSVVSLRHATLSRARVAECRGFDAAFLRRIHAVRNGTFPLVSLGEDLRLDRWQFDRKVQGLSREALNAPDADFGAGWPSIWTGSLCLTSPPWPDGQYPEWVFGTPQWV